MDIIDYLLQDPYSYYTFPMSRLYRQKAMGTPASKTTAATKDGTSKDASDEKEVKNKTELRNALRRAISELYGNRDNGKPEYDIFVVRDANLTAKAYGIRMVYAPFKKCEIDIQVEDNVLTICVVDTAEAAEEGENETLDTKENTFSGIPWEPFKLSIPFADICNDSTVEVDSDAIKATTNDGVLEVLLPVVRKTTSRRVPLV